MTLLLLARTDLKFSSTPRVYSNQIINGFICATIFPVVPNGLFCFALFLFFFLCFLSHSHSHPLVPVHSCAAWSASSSITLEMNWMMALYYVPEKTFIDQCNNTERLAKRVRDNVRVSIYICVLCVVHVCARCVTNRKTYLYNVTWHKIHVDV